MTPPRGGGGGGGETGGGGGGRAGGGGGGGGGVPDRPHGVPLVMHKGHQGMYDSQRVRVTGGAGAGGGEVPDRPHRVPIVMHKQHQGMYDSQRVGVTPGGGGRYLIDLMESPLSCTNDTKAWMTAMRPARAFSSPCNVQIGFPALLKMKTCFLCCFHAADTPPCPSAYNREAVGQDRKRKRRNKGEGRRTKQTLRQERREFNHTAGCEHQEQAVYGIQEDQLPGCNMRCCQSCVVYPCTLLDVQACLQTCQKIE